MNHERVCPTCHRTFGDENDFCPDCGTLLVANDAAGVSPVHEASSSEPTQEDVSPAATPSAAQTPAGAPTAPSASNVADEPLPGTPPREESQAGSKFADFMRRFRRRSSGDRETPEAEDRLSDGSTADEPQLPLPKEVLEKGWRITGPVETRPGLHHWPVERVSGDLSPVPGHFHRFRTGSLTTGALYRHLENSLTSQLARIWAHGTVDSGGAREDYELVSVPKAGRRLNHWCAEGTPSEPRAWHLFPKLLALLEALDKAGVQPLAIEPTHVMVAHEGELWLTTAALLTETSAEPFYRPGLEHSALLSQGWSAPELGQENMVTPNAVVFSVGQILALALWGHPCSPAELQIGAIPFKSISDAGLARILMGCLWPRSQGRWTVDDLRRAATAPGAEAMPATAPWDSLAPGASSTAFSFAGASYWRLETLLADAVQPTHWREATVRIGDILNWADNTAWIGQAELMRAALKQGRSADWVLVALTRVVRPEAPLTWRSLDLSDIEAARSLAGLAQRALRGGEPELEMLNALFEADLRGAFAPLPPQP